MNQGWGWLVLSPVMIVVLAFFLVSQPASQGALTHVVTDKKVVAITFDDGPSPKYTPLILKTLSQYHAYGTFFVVGSEVKRFPGLVKDIARQGSAIADHGWSHLNLRRVGAQALWNDAAKTAQYVQSLGVPVVPFYRPPYGMVSTALLKTFGEHGYTVVLWSIDTRDWARPGIASIINKVATQVKPGSIILLHDGGGNRSQTVAALNAILEQLTQMGYKMVTLPTLVKEHHDAPKAI
ncbi:polysaccharide deacetylase family protein [Sulfobacillus thermosulfidooxidans]|uniref:polysaccharide deacetylase family protein n=1 Tax=Sulfobacillus thermosulfidooxidans TaxID=28034 RepID=UPI000408833E|nr:polysaccharide deacetylase family protein [Sulfobacillus thermosulfidooxidans]